LDDPWAAKLSFGLRDPGILSRRGNVGFNAARCGSGRLVEIDVGNQSVAPGQRF
jgi:hypothetical protein